MNINFESMTDDQLAATAAMLREAQRRAEERKAEPPAYQLTELGNAKRFTEKFHGELLFVHDQQQWFHWDGRLWRIDMDGHALRQFEEVIKDLAAERDRTAAVYTKAAEGSDNQEALERQLREQSGWYKASQRISVMSNSLKLAAAQEGMSKPLREFDSKGHFFGCANGIVDLRDGSLITGDRRYLMTKSSSVNYRPDAECPEWERFLLTIMEGNPENVRFLQRLVGQAMLGTQGKDKLAILWGSGANGKSTFVDTLNDVMGPYATVTDPRMLMDSQRANKEYYLAPLKGVRLLLMSETKRGDMIAESIVKMLVDGGEITARYPAGRVFTFQPVFTPILSTNHRPKVGADPAIWRRVLLVPFTHIIPTEQRNPRFRAEVLAPEAEGILRWAVAGAMAYLEEGLAPTGTVVEATEEYRRSQDKIGLFIEERCSTGGDGRTRLVDLLEMYNDWCTSQGLQTMGRTTFKEELLMKAFAVRQSTGHQDWVYGIVRRKPELTLSPEEPSVVHFFR
jgi:putative DNA primase/helicase